MLAVRQLCAAANVHASCVLPLDDTPHAPHAVVLCAVASSLHAMHLHKSNDDDNGSGHDSASVQQPQQLQLTPQSHVMNVGSPVLALSPLSHQCFVACTRDMELLVVRYQATLPPGIFCCQDDDSSDCDSDSSDNTTASDDEGDDTHDDNDDGNKCRKRNDDDDDDTACLPHWRHWLVLHRQRMRAPVSRRGVALSVCASPRLVVNARGDALEAMLYEGVVHCVRIDYARAARAAAKEALARAAQQRRRRRHRRGKPDEHASRGTAAAVVTRGARDSDGDAVHTSSASSNDYTSAAADAVVAWWSCGCYYGTAWSPVHALERYSHGAFAFVDAHDDSSSSSNDDDSDGRRRRRCSAETTSAHTDSDSSSSSNSSSSSDDDARAASAATDVEQSAEATATSSRRQRHGRRRVHARELLADSHVADAALLRTHTIDELVAHKQALSTLHFTTASARTRWLPTVHVDVVRRRRRFVMAATWPLLGVPTMTTACAYSERMQRAKAAAAAAATTNTARARRRAASPRRRADSRHYAHYGDRHAHHGNIGDNNDNDDDNDDDEDNDGFVHVYTPPHRTTSGAPSHDGDHHTVVLTTASSRRGDVGVELTATCVTCVIAVPCYDHYHDNDNDYMTHTRNSDGAVASSNDNDDEHDSDAADEESRRVTSQPHASSCCAYIVVFRCRGTRCVVRAHRHCSGHDAADASSGQHQQQRRRGIGDRDVARDHVVRRRHDDNSSDDDDDVLVSSRHRVVDALLCLPATRTRTRTAATIRHTETHDDGMLYMVLDSGALCALPLACCVHTTRAARTSRLPWVRAWRARTRRGDATTTTTTSSSSSTQQATTTTTTTTITTAASRRGAVTTCRIRGLPADFVARRLLPLHVANASCCGDNTSSDDNDDDVADDEHACRCHRRGVAHSTYSRQRLTRRYALVVDDVASVYVLDLWHRCVVAAYVGPGAMMAVCAVATTTTTMTTRRADAYGDDGHGHMQHMRSSSHKHMHTHTLRNVLVTAYATGWLRQLVPVLPLRVHTYMHVTAATVSTRAATASVDTHGHDTTTTAAAVRQLFLLHGRAHCRDAASSSLLLLLMVSGDAYTHVLRCVRGGDGAWRLTHVSPHMTSHDDNDDNNDNDDSDNDDDTTRDRVVTSVAAWAGGESTLAAVALPRTTRRGNNNDNDNSDDTRGCHIVQCTPTRLCVDGVTTCRLPDSAAAVYTHAAVTTWHCAADDNVSSNNNADDNNNDDDDEATRRSCCYACYSGGSDTRRLLVVSCAPSRRVVARVLYDAAAHWSCDVACLAIHKLEVDEEEQQQQQQQRTTALSSHDTHNAHNAHDDGNGVCTSATTRTTRLCVLAGLWDGSVRIDVLQAKTAAATTAATTTDASFGDNNDELWRVVQSWRLPSPLCAAATALSVPRSLVLLPLLTTATTTMHARGDGVMTWLVTHHDAHTTALTRQRDGGWQWCVLPATTPHAAPPSGIGACAVLHCSNDNDNNNDEQRRRRRPHVGFDVALLQPSSVQLLSLSRTHNDNDDDKNDMAVASRARVTECAVRPTCAVRAALLTSCDTRAVAAPVTSCNTLAVVADVVDDDAAARRRRGEAACVLYTFFLASGNDGIVAATLPPMQPRRVVRRRCALPPLTHRHGNTRDSHTVAAYTRNAASSSSWTLTTRTPTVMAEVRRAQLPCCVATQQQQQQHTNDDDDDDDDGDAAARVCTLVTAGSVCGGRRLVCLVDCGSNSNNSNNNDDNNNNKRTHRHLHVDDDGGGDTTARSLLYSVDAATLHVLDTLPLHSTTALCMAVVPHHTNVDTTASNVDDDDGNKTTKNSSSRSDEDDDRAFDTLACTHACADELIIVGVAQTRCVGSSSSNTTASSSHATRQQHDDSSSSSSSSMHEQRGHLLLLLPHPLRVVGASLSHARDATAMPPIVDVAVQRLTSTTATMTTRRDTGCAAHTSTPATSVLVAAVGGGAVWLYALHGYAFVLLCRSDLSMSCGGGSSVALCYPYLSVGLGDGGCVYLQMHSTRRQQQQQQQQGKEQQLAKRSALVRNSNSNDNDNDSSKEDSERNAMTRLCDCHTPLPLLPLPPTCTYALRVSAYEPLLHSALLSQAAYGAGGVVRVDTRGNVWLVDVRRRCANGDNNNNNNDNNNNSDSSRRRRAAEAQVLQRNDEWPVVGVTASDLCVTRTNAVRLPSMAMAATTLSPCIGVVVRSSGGRSRAEDAAASRDDGGGSAVATALLCAFERSAPLQLRCCERCVTLASLGAYRHDGGHDCHHHHHDEYDDAAVANEQTLPPSLLLLPCRDGSLYAARPLPSVLGHMLLRLEQRVADLHADSEALIPRHLLLLPSPSPSSLCGRGHNTSGLAARRDGGATHGCVYHSVSLHSSCGVSGAVYTAHKDAAVMLDVLDELVTPPPHADNNNSNNNNNNNNNNNDACVRRRHALVTRLVRRLLAAEYQGEVTVRDVVDLLCAL